jgi:hypothetical protein
VCVSVAAYIVVTVWLAPSFIYDRYKPKKGKSKQEGEECNVNTKHKLSIAATEDSQDSDDEENKENTNRIIEHVNQSLDNTDIDHLSEDKVSNSVFREDIANDDHFGYGVSIDLTLDHHHSLNYHSDNQYTDSSIFVDDWDHYTISDGMFESCVHDVYVYQDVALSPDDTCVEEEVLVDHLFQGSREHHSFFMKDGVIWEATSNEAVIDSLKTASSLAKPKLNSSQSFRRNDQYMTMR